jgi:hypothetical protein
MSTKFVHKATSLAPWIALLFQAFDYNDNKSRKEVSFDRSLTSLSESGSDQKDPDPLHFWEWCCPRRGRWPEGLAAAAPAACCDFWPPPGHLAAYNCGFITQNLLSPAVLLNDILQDRIETAGVDDNCIILFTDFFRRPSTDFYCSLDQPNVL